MSLIYLINLDCVADRVPEFSSQLDIHRISAIDTRSRTNEHTKFGLSLNPPDKISKLYFSLYAGALGCYLSHYIFWKKVIEGKNNYALVLEDDADPNDVERLIASDTLEKHLNNNKPTLLQLNKRTTYDKLPFWFDGTESYAVNKAGAKSLLDLTYDFSCFENTFIEYAWDWPELKGGKQQLFTEWADHDANINYTQKNTIRYAVDKFIGYCGMDNVPTEKRLNIIIENKVGINEKYKNQSDILNQRKLTWQMSLQELKKCETDDNYMWWSKHENNFNQ